MCEYEIEYVCANCIGESYLKNEIIETGSEKKCSVCGDIAPSILLTDLADRIHDVISNNYIQTPTDSYWGERSGELVEDLIGGLAVIEPEVATAIKEYLSDVHDAYGKDAAMEEQPYSDEAQYGVLETDTLDFSESWSFFKNDIRKHSRFFNRHAHESLDHIFKNLELLKTRGGESVIQEISPEDSCTHIYRARIVATSLDLENVLKGLPGELGAPPYQHAQAGRMNASGIAVFYGALDMDTCIAEIRAPVGSAVVVGKFQPLRSLRVLNFSRLKEIFVKGSDFEPGFKEALSRAKFLDQLVYELSAPILPTRENHEYLPTQVVAEYLSQRKDLKLDGVMFGSSQLTEKGENVVLFNHACDVEPYKLPEGSSIDVSLGFGTEDDYDDSITIWEECPAPETLTKEKQSNRSDLLAYIGFEGLDKFDEVINTTPTLRLDIENVQVVMIKGVRYDHLPRSVARHRREERNNKKF